MNNTSSSDSGKQLSEYIFPSQSGEFTGTLTYIKRFDNKDCIFCYFITDSGNKLVLPLWLNKSTGRFTPTETNICFNSETDTQTKWQCKYTVTQNKSGKPATKFISARLIKSSAGNEKSFAKKFMLMLIKRAYPRCLVANLALRKFNPSDDIIGLFVDEGQGISYEISKNKSGNWQVTRSKNNKLSEKNITVCIDDLSFDIISKEYN